MKRHPIPSLGAIWSRLIASLDRRPPRVRVATYTRVRQEDLCRDYIAAQPGWEHVAVYQDDNTSRISRPGLNHALAAARDGQYDVLLVSVATEISRRTAVLLSVVGELRAAGAELRSATQPGLTFTTVELRLLSVIHLADPTTEKDSDRG